MDITDSSRHPRPTAGQCSKRIVGAAGLTTYQPIAAGLDGHHLPETAPMDGEDGRRTAGWNELARDLARAAEEKRRRKPYGHLQDSATSPSIGGEHA